MKFIFKSVLSIFLLVSCACHAGVIESGKITKIAIDKGNGEKVFIMVEGTKTGSPACHGSTEWAFVMPLISELDKSMFSMLLTARASQALVRLYGDSQCNTYGRIETLTFITY